MISGFFNNRNLSISWYDIGLKFLCKFFITQPSSFSRAEGLSLKATEQADRQYRAVYELFNYFYRNEFLFRNFNSVTNNSNNSYAFFIIPEF